MVWEDSWRGREDESGWCALHIKNTNSPLFYYISPFRKGQKQAKWKHSWIDTSTCTLSIYERDKHIYHNGLSNIKPWKESYIGQKCYCKRGKYYL